MVRDRANYGNRVYYKDICIECEQPPEDGEKFCHTCNKYKPLKDYRRYLLGRVQYKEIVTANNCKSCEAEGAKEKEWTDVRPTENDADKIDWYCNFIGDTDYKDICKVFKISDQPMEDDRSYQKYREAKAARLKAIKQALKEKR